ncbi:guanylate-binding protein 1-like [Branchiostoma floridae x Branchiostoma japonicum]
MEVPKQLTETRVVNGRRQIYISPEAERIISNLQPRSVDVVAVVGPMRKGKSHLANLLCKRKSGFPLGHKLESETKDFWFWIGTHPVQTDDRYLMVVDTEGLDDYFGEEQSDKDMKYLVLATLLSNHMIFNLQGNLDRNLVTNLRLMGDLAERIRVQKDGNDDGINLGEHFPELWVTVQQVLLELPEGNGSPDEYLEAILKRKDGHTKAIRSHNEMTDAVKAFFPKRHLRLIPPPSGDANVCKNLHKVEDSDLPKNYTDAVGEFTGEIWNSNQVKRVNGEDINATGLLDILRYYVNAINDPDTVPSIVGAHEAIADGECSRVSEECMKQFQETVEERVKKHMPMDEETCNRRIQTASETAVSKLSADVGKWDKDGKWKKDLEENLEKVRVDLLKDNDSKSKAVCEKIMGEADKTVRQKVESGGYNRVGGFDMYVRDMEGVIRTYNKKASGKGPAVEKVLETFGASETTRRNAIKQMARKVEEVENRVEEERKKRQEAEQRGTTGADVAVAGFNALGEVGKGLGYAVGETAKGLGYVVLSAAMMSQRRNMP